MEKKKNHQYIWLGDAPCLRTVMGTKLESSFSWKAPELTLLCSIWNDDCLQIQIDWFYMVPANWNKCSEITFFIHPIYSRHVKQRNAETIWQGLACSCGTAFSFCKKLIKMFRHYAKRPMSILFNFCSQIYLNDTNFCSLFSVNFSYTVIWPKKNCYLIKTKPNDEDKPHKVITKQSAVN